MGMLWVLNGNLFTKNIINKFSICLSMFGKVCVWKGTHIMHPFIETKIKFKLHDFHVRDDLFIFLAKNTIQIEKLPLFYKFSLAFYSRLNDDFDKLSTPFETI
jgi:hypothetical protein